MGLIRLEFDPKREKIGDTTAMLPLPFNADKPIVPVGARGDADNAARRRIERLGDLTFVTVLAL